MMETVNLRWMSGTSDGAMSPSAPSVRSKRTVYSVAHPVVVSIDTVVVRAPCQPSERIRYVTTLPWVDTRSARGVSANASKNVALVAAGA
jgi:hypothetical protein